MVARTETNACSSISGTDGVDRYVQARISRNQVFEGCPGQVAPAVPPRPRAVVYSGPEYGFSGPSGIAAGASRLWVSNLLGNSVTQLRAGTGKWAATLPGGHYGFAGPEARAAGTGGLWVANVQANSVIEVNAATGSLLRTLSGRSYGFDDPCALALAGRSCGWPTRGPPR